MDQMIWFLPYAYPVELAHLTFALVGFLTNVLTVYYALGDVEHVLRNRHKWSVEVAEERTFGSHRNLREELARLALNTIFVSIGLVSIFNAPPGGQMPDDLTFQLLYTRWALTVGSVFLTFKSVKDLTDRRYLLGRYQEGH